MSCRGMCVCAACARKGFILAYDEREDHLGGPKPGMFLLPGQPNMYVQQLLMQQQAAQHQLGGGLQSDGYSDDDSDADNDEKSSGFRMGLDPQMLQSKHPLPAQMFQNPQLVADFLSNGIPPEGIPDILQQQSMHAFLEQQQFRMAQQLMTQPNDVPEGKMATEEVMPTQLYPPDQFRSPLGDFGRSIEAAMMARSLGILPYGMQRADTIHRSAPNCSGLNPPSPSSYSSGDETTSPSPKVLRRPEHHGWPTKTPNGADAVMQPLSPSCLPTPSSSSTPSCSGAPSGLPSVSLSPHPKKLARKNSLAKLSCQETQPLEKSGTKPKKPVKFPVTALKASKKTQKTLAPSFSPPPSPPLPALFSAPTSSDFNDSSSSAFRSADTLPEHTAFDTLELPSPTLALSKSPQNEDKKSLSPVCETPDASRAAKSAVALAQAAAAADTSEGGVCAGRKPIQLGKSLHKRYRSTPPEVVD